MLPRTLEPEVMDDTQEAILYDSMDHRQVNARFVEDFLAHAAAGERVVDLGAGTARIPIELCMKCETTTVMAVDAATSMLDVAIRNIDIAGLRGRIQLFCADAKRLDALDDACCDSVISNTLLHHVAEPASVLREAVRIVKPNGRIFIRDLMRPDSDSEVERLTELHAANEPDASKQLLRQSLHAALTLEEAKQMLSDCGLDPAHVHATSDRHWTIDSVRS